jgi:hypothetical protein
LAPDQNAMEILAMRGQMLGAKRTKMMWMGLFLWCGENGYLARNCLSKPKEKR